MHAPPAFSNFKLLLLDAPTHAFLATTPALLTTNLLLLDLLLRLPNPRLLRRRLGFRTSSIAVKLKTPLSSTLGLLGRVSSTALRKLPAELLVQIPLLDAQTGDAVTDGTSSCT